MYNKLIIFVSLLTLIFASGQSGCNQDTPIPCGALETVGKVTTTKATIQLVANADCIPTVTFQLFYDTIPQEIGNYAQETSILTGFEEHMPIVFNLVSLLPNTQYYYRVAYGLNGEWNYRPEFSFYTAP